MKPRMLAFLAIPIFYALTVLAESLQFQSNEAQSGNPFPRGFAHYYKQMDGTPEKDSLGTRLPSGLNAKAIAKIIAPKENVNFAIVIGAKAFPYRLNSYVTIVCFARTKGEYDMAASDKSCQKKTYNRDDIIYLGLIEYEPTKSQLKLIAKPLEVKTDWIFIDNQQFRANRKNSNLLPSGKYFQFDLAPFKVTPTNTAFGLRIGSTTSYSGGFGYFESLSLFMVEGDRVINILAEPMYFYQNLAGEWNKDRTRKRDLREGENVLVVLPSKTNDHYDLQIKSLDSKWQQIFLWDNSQKRYLSEVLKRK